MIEKTTSDSVKVNNRTLKAIQSGKRKSLAEAFPEIAKEWCYKKNGDLTPEMVTYGSGQKVWWQCEYGHKWQTAICGRTGGSGCPYCSKNGTSRPELTLLYYIRKHISADTIHRYRELGCELDIYIPERKIAIEYDGVRFHQNTKKDITKNKKCFEHNVKLYRVREEGLPNLNDSSVDYFYKDKNNTSFSEVISTLLTDITRTEIIIDVNKDFAEINDFIKRTEIEESLAKHNPELAAEWHPTKNGSLTPEMVPPNSNLKVWWQGKCGHEWNSTVAHRTTGHRGCPYCAGKKVLPGFNDLATINPNLAKEWHPTKNNDLMPNMVTSGSGQKVWWKCEHGHEWEAVIGNRTNGNGCPYCSGHKVWSGYNDLATTHPDIAAEWNYAMNGDLTPEVVSAGSNIKVWWVCKHGHDFPAAVNNRTNGKGCPYCSGQKVLPGFNDLATTHPEIATEWHPTKNEDLTSKMVSAGSNKTVWWQCKHGHDWQASVVSRSLGSNCPYCAGKKVWVGFNDLATTHPEIAAEWHPDKNGDLTPEMVSAGSALKVWWKCKKGHEWQSTIANRNNGNGCPYCSGRCLIPGVTDLTTTHPTIAKIWHLTKNALSALMVTAGSGKKVWWQCPHCGHEYQRTIANQTRKDPIPRCPHCKTPVTVAKSA